MQMKQPQVLHCFAIVPSSHSGSHVAQSCDISRLNAICLPQLEISCPHSFASSFVLVKDAVGPSKARQLHADLHDASRTALYAAAQGPRTAEICGWDARWCHNVMIVDHVTHWSSLVTNRTNFWGVLDVIAGPVPYICATSCQLHEFPPQVATWVW